MKCDERYMAIDCGVVRVHDFSRERAGVDLVDLADGRARDCTRRELEDVRKLCRISIGDAARSLLHLVTIAVILITDFVIATTIFVFAVEARAFALAFTPRIIVFLFLVLLILQLTLCLL